MISDVLSDSVDAIREYQEGMPDAYAGMKDQIDAVVKQMDLLRAYFDMPPLVISGEALGWRNFAVIPMAFLENPYTPEPVKELARDEIMKMAVEADRYREAASGLAGPASVV